MCNALCSVLRSVQCVLWGRQRRKGPWLWLWLLVLVICDGWQVTHDTWHETPDTCCLTPDGRFLCVFYYIVLLRLYASIKRFTVPACRIFGWFDCFGSCNWPGHLKTKVSLFFFLNYVIYLVFIANISGISGPSLPIFKASALWADAFYKSICPSVCLSVCPSVCPSVHFWCTT